MLSKELDEALVRDFPNAFRDRHASIMETPMGFGFECGDGWEPLVREIAVELEAFILSLPFEQRHAVRAAQVKEKFGGLRFYVDADYITAEHEFIQIDLPPTVVAAINHAEERSLQTCEVCGRPGRAATFCGWVRTRCNEHCRRHKTAANTGEQNG